MCVIIAILCVFCCLLAAAGAATPADSLTSSYTLQELIDSAMSRNAEILEGQWKVEGSAAQLRQARAAFFLPRLRLQSENGLVPDAKGDIFNPPEDTTGLRSLGPFNRTQLEFVQPLFTFGQLSDLRRAATGALAVEVAALAQTRIEVAFEVKKLYYGVLLAQDLRNLVERLSEEIDEKLEEVDEEILSLADSYKLKLTRLELDRQQEDAVRQLELARAALAWKAGLPADLPIELETRWLEPVTAAVPPLEQLTEQALERRPDWRKLQAGISARKAQEDAARSAFYPQIFLAGGIRYAVAPGRTDQHNPYVKDSFNYFNGGVFVGLRQSFEWGLLGADVAKARAAHRELKAKEIGAVQGIRLDVQRVYLEFEQAAQALDSATQARKLARQWLKLAKEDYEFDPQTLDELVTAFEAWARLEQKYYEAIFDFNTSLARLEKAAGSISLEERQ